MSGLASNTWKSFLQGTSSLFNFSYDAETQPPTQENVLMPATPPSQLPPTPSPGKNVKNKTNIPLMPPMIRGGYHHSRSSRTRKQHKKQKSKKIKRITRKW
jgi:hypothetical protein